MKKSGYITLAAVCFGVLTVQYSGSLAGLFVSSLVDFRSNDGKTRWSASVSNLPPGRYFLSAGRPRARCNIFVDGSSVTRNSDDINEPRSDLFLGHELVISEDPNSPKEIELRCTPIWRSSLTHKIILQTKALGLAIHVARFASQMIIGQLVALMFLLVTAFSAYLIWTSRSFDRQAQARLVGCATFFFTSLCYLVSLAYYPRLLISEFDAYLTHVLLRNLFSLSFLYFCFCWGGISMRSFVVIAIVHSLQIAATYMIWRSSPERMLRTYPIQFIAFSLCTAWTAIRLKTTRVQDGAILLLRPVVWIWAALQILDITISTSTVPIENFGPGILMILFVCFLFLVAAEMERIADLRITNFANQSRVQIAAQVAHDMRSPLVALRRIQASDLSDDAAEILVAATRRLTSISADLISLPHRREQSWFGYRTTDAEDDSTSTADIAPLIDQLANEKRIVAPDIQIRAIGMLISHPDSSIVRIRPSYIQRMVSCLVDNSIEAKARNIEISLSRNNTWLTIDVQDDGIGIPEAIRPRLGSLGATFNKVSGHGMGLSWTRSQVSRIGGELVIYENKNGLTRVRIAIPVTEKK